MDSEEGRDPGIGRESPSVPPPPAVPAIASSQLPRGESHPVAVDGSGSPSRQASGSPASARQGEAEEVDDGEGGLGLETRRQVAGRVIRDAAKWLVGKWDPNVNVFGLWRNREARRQRLPVLDGVRTLALAWIFAAVIYSSVVFEGGRLQFPVASQFALNADLAVDLLLLVSGTAVTAAILAEVEDARSFDVLRFYWRRLLSLWPPLAIGLLLTVTFVQDAEVSCRSALPLRDAFVAPVGSRHPTPFPVIPTCSLSPRSLTSIFPLDCSSVSWEGSLCGTHQRLVSDGLQPDSPDPSRSWWAVLLFINNIYGDQRCMPQTWLIAVLFQLYVITPAITFACVNYFAVSLRRLYSGYILIYFMSLVSVAIAWIIYEVS